MTLITAFSYRVYPTSIQGLAADPVPISFPHTVSCSVQGIDRAFEAMEVTTQMVEDARPLLNRVIELVDEVRGLRHKP